MTSRARRPGKRIALSFDDGPDPRWTPRIAATLRRLKVPATFFVVGSQVVRHPGVIRELKAQGFELGNHTFTHSDLAALPAWERTLQIGLTENAVAGTVGLRPRLFRPPYSSTPDAVTTRQHRSLEQLARRGYVIALSDLDGEDWRRPGVEAIVRAITPTGESGGIVLLHDGGGDRSETVAAIERVVPRLRARGFRFVPVSELAGLPPYDVEVSADDWGRDEGTAAARHFGGRSADDVSDRRPAHLRRRALPRANRAAPDLCPPPREARSPPPGRRGVRTARLCRRARVQRSSRHRAGDQVARSQRLSRLRDHRGGRRLDGRHSGSRRRDSSCHASRYFASRTAASPPR